MFFDYVLHMFIATYLLLFIQIDCAPVPDANPDAQVIATTDDHVFESMKSKEYSAIVFPDHIDYNKLFSNPQDQARDKSSFCPYWAILGECTTNPDYMQNSCIHSCSSISYKPPAISDKPNDDDTSASSDMSRVSSTSQSSESPEDIESDESAEDSILVSVNKEFLDTTSEEKQQVEISSLEESESSEDQGDKWEILVEIPNARKEAVESITSASAQLEVSSSSDEDLSHEELVLPAPVESLEEEYEDSAESIDSILSKVNRDDAKDEGQYLDHLADLVRLPLVTPTPVEPAKEEEPALEEPVQQEVPELANEPLLQAHAHNVEDVDTGTDKIQFSHPLTPELASEQPVIAVHAVKAIQPIIIVQQAEEEEKVILLDSSSEEKSEEEADKDEYWPHAPPVYQSNPLSLALQKKRLTTPGGQAVQNSSPDTSAVKATVASPPGFNIGQRPQQYESQEDRINELRETFKLPKLERVELPNIVFPQFNLSNSYLFRNPVRVQQQYVQSVPQVMPTAQQSFFYPQQHQAPPQNAVSFANPPTDVSSVIKGPDGKLYGLVPLGDDPADVSYQQPVASAGQIYQPLYHNYPQAPVDQRQLTWSSGQVDSQPTTRNYAPTATTFTPHVPITEQAMSIFSTEDIKRLMVELYGEAAQHFVYETPKNNEQSGADVVDQVVEESVEELASDTLADEDGIRPKKSNKKAAA